jgi:motility quorum-sensing regulator/GCU-specific mRNA interferase toxin
MEKRTSHYKLSKVKSLIQSGQYIITGTARKAAAFDFAFSEEQIISAVLSLDMISFYKSMTSHTDHTLWQDVYKSVLEKGIRAYIKLQIIEETSVIVSFKEE